MFQIRHSRASGNADCRPMHSAIYSTLVMTMYVRAPSSNELLIDQSHRLRSYLYQRLPFILVLLLSILINSWWAAEVGVHLSFANTSGQDGNVQHAINCPAAPTRLDRDIGNNIDLNMTLFNQLLSFSKDGETFSLEDLSEAHHLRHNQSRSESPHWQFGNSDATCAL